MDCIAKFASIASVSYSMCCACATGRCALKSLLLIGLRACRRLHAFSGARVVVAPLGAAQERCAPLSRKGVHFLKKWAKSKARRSLRHELAGESARLPAGKLPSR
eukprot:3303898-Pleurochrysis_carterae.AAC.1